MQEKTIIVAELGINHNSDFDLLLKMTDAAFDCGADYVKLQLRTPEICVPKDQWDKPRQWFDGSWTTYIDYKKRMELSLEQLHEFDIYVRKNHGPQRWFASIWDEPSIERLARFSVPYVKLPSAMLHRTDLIEMARNRFHRVILSTGMSSREEKMNAIRLFDPGEQLTLLHSTSTYPCPDKEIGLSSILSLNYAMYDIAWEEKNHQDEIDWKVGFSSHSPSVYPAIYSSIIGAYMVEVHFTLDRTMQGSDHAASIEPPGLRLLCREIARIPVLWGDGRLDYYESELAKRKSLRGE